MTEMTNDQYHDLLDANKAARMDFRYVNVDNGGVEFSVEAYQITGRSRFQTEDWPAWLQMQKSPMQLNKVYCDAASPNDLTLMKSDGMEQPLGTGDWLVLYKTGEIEAVPDMNFQHFNKVVTVPAKPVPPESAADFEAMWELDENNKLVPRTTPLPTPGIDDLESNVISVSFDGEAGDLRAEVDVLRQQMNIAIEFLAGGASKGAIKATQHLEIGLETAKDGGLEWCNCDPGSCDESTKWGCRKKSPLL